MKHIILFLIFVIFSSSAAAKWTRIDNYGTQGVEIFVEKEGINKDGNIATIWTLADYEKPQFVGGKRKLSTMSWNEYYCQNKQYRTLILYWYSGHKGEGKIVYSEMVPGKIKLIVPNSTAEKIWKITCSKKK